jgi:hypothetical protein
MILNPQIEVKGKVEEMIEGQGKKIQVSLTYSALRYIKQLVDLHAQIFLNRASRIDDKDTIELCKQCRQDLEEVWTLLNP